MALGPGKYDNLATYCMEQTDAQAVVVIVFGGNLGHGMSGKERRPAFNVAMKREPILKRQLAAALRAVAKTLDDAPDEAFNA